MNSNSRRLTKMKTRAALIAGAVAAGLTGGSVAQAGPVFTVTNTNASGNGSLGQAIAFANAAGGGATIQIQDNLGAIPTSLLPDIVTSMTIDGGVGNTLTGQSAQRIFFIDAPGAQVNIANLTMANGFARGGDGGRGGGTGGGGAGLGGAVFINAGNVSFSSVAFVNNAAQGGSGGNSAYGGGGGGGGMGFGGGTGGYDINTLLGAGAGGGARTSAGADGAALNGGQGGGINGAGGGQPAGGGGTSGGSAPGPDGAGGGGGFDNSAYNGINFGGGGGSGNDFGGGGGGGGSRYNNAANGGQGGFGAGGGGGADAGQGTAGNGGNGGFGGGGGGAGGSPYTVDYGPSFGGDGGFGGGAGSYSNEGTGGGGAGFGAAVFVRDPNRASVAFTDCSTDGGSVIAGLGGASGLGHNGDNGTAAGGAFFLMGGTAAINVSPGKAQTIAGTIAESSPTQLRVAGGGMLILSANNGGLDGYSGGTAILGGSILSISSDSALGAAAGALEIDGTLQLGGTTATSTARAITLDAGGGTFDINDPAGSLTITHAIGGSGPLTKTGAGTLTLTALNTFTGQTLVDAGTLALGRGADASGGTFAGTPGVIVNGGGSLILGAGPTSVSNALGFGGAGNAIPPLTINAGGFVTTAGGTTHNLNVINLAGGTLYGASSAPQPFGNWTFNGNVNVDTTSGTSDIAAPVGVGLRGTINFNVSAGVGVLDVVSPLADEAGSVGGVTKSGPGVMLVSGSNTYTGPTVINGGTLAFAGAATLASPSITVNVGGTLRFDRNDLFGDAATVSPSTVISVNGGTVASNNTFTTLGTLNLSGGTLVANGGANATYQALQLRGPVNVAGTDASVIAGSTLANSAVHLSGTNGGTTFNVNSTGAENGDLIVSATLADGFDNSEPGHQVSSTLTKTGPGTMVLSAANTYTGYTIVTGGTLLVADPQALGFGGLAIRQTGTQVLVAPGLPKAVAVAALNMDPMTRLDLANNKLIIHDNAVGTWNGSQYTDVSGLVASARNGGTWTGSGITSGFAATGGSNLYSIGVAKAGDIKQIADSATATFAGQTVHGSDTIVMFTYGGDANLDGKINIDDYGRIDGNVGQSGSVFGWYNGDFNYDGKINIDDYGIIDGNIGQQGAPIPTAASALSDAGVSAVPEPANLALITLAGAGLLCRRRRIQGYQEFA